VAPPRVAGRGAGFAALALLVCSCGSSSASPSAVSDVASVAGTPITQTQLDVRLQSALADLSGAGGPTGNPQMLTSVTATVIGSLIFDTVVAQEASRLGMAASQSQVADRIRQFTQDAGGATQLQSQLAAAGQSMAGLRDEITSEINEENVEAYFAQIRAQQVITQLDQGSDFGSLVSQYSDSPDTASKGGQLGTLSAAQITSQLGPAVLTAVQSLHPGQFTPSPVRDSSGFEILLVDAVSAAGWTLREILVAAPQPYTVKERPDWFAEEVYYQIYQDCQSGRISLFGSYAKVPGADPCSAGSPPGSPPPALPASAGATAQGSPASATASPGASGSSSAGASPAAGSASPGTSGSSSAAASP
jgi:parvulin-like peptidyl-prolyl isomerase